MNGCDFEVDVVNMVQTNLETGERWMIAVEESEAKKDEEATLGTMGRLGPGALVEGGLGSLGCLGSL